MFRLDWTAFRAGDRSSASDNRWYWKERTMEERLRGRATSIAWHGTARQIIRRAWIERPSVKGSEVERMLSLLLRKKN